MLVCKPEWVDRNGEIPPGQGGVIVGSSIKLNRLWAVTTCQKTKHTLHMRPTPGQRYINDRSQAKGFRIARARQRERVGRF